MLFERGVGRSTVVARMEQAVTAVRACCRAFSSNAVRAGVAVRPVVARMDRAVTAVRACSRALARMPFVQCRAFDL